MHFLRSLKRLALLALFPAVSACSAIPVDKQLHMAAGVGAHVTQRAAVSALPEGASLRSRQTTIHQRCALATVLGIGKEIRDSRTHRGTVDPMDAVATIAACYAFDLLLQAWSSRRPGV